MRQSLFGLSTNFYEIEGDLKNRLILEEELGVHKLADVKDKENDTLEDRYKENYSNRAKLTEKRKEWLDKVLNKLPDGCQYKEKMFFFRHSDSVRIVETVLANCKTKDFMGMEEKFNPFYGVAVRAQKMAAAVTPCRVIVACVSYNPESVA